MNRMFKFEQPGNQKTPKSLESGVESREAFGDRALRAAQEVYAEEMQTLERKVSRYGNLKNIGFVFALPVSLYVIGKFFGVDIGQTTGLDISESTDAVIRLSWAISMLGASSASFAQIHFEKKLKHLKDKFGVL